MPAAALAAPTDKSVPTPEECEYSIPTWKAVPSSWDVLFSLRLPYRPPENALMAYVWRKRVWFETTFALTMMEPWEKMVLLLVLTTLSVLFTSAFIAYFPLHLAVIISRAKYYLSGTPLPSAGSFSTADGYGLGKLGDLTHTGIEKLVQAWKMWNGTGAGASGEL